MRPHRFGTGHLSQVAVAHEIRSAACSHTAFDITLITMQTCKLLLAVLVAAALARCERGRVYALCRARVTASCPQPSRRCRRLKKASGAGCRAPVARAAAAASRRRWPCVRSLNRCLVPPLPLQRPCPRHPSADPESHQCLRRGLHQGSGAHLRVALRHGAPPRAGSRCRGGCSAPLTTSAARFASAAARRI